MENACDGPPEITRLLREWQEGDRQALDRLIPLVYDELRVIASRRIDHEWRGRALQTTALVNEAYLKLIDQRRVDWQSRAHFLAVAAQVMRRILIDDARSATRLKRGGATVEVPLDDVSISAVKSSIDIVDVLALDRVLTDLEELDPEQARIVELRFFGGLTVEETAVVMGVSESTINRDWAVAKGWLFRELTR